MKIILEYKQKWVEAINRCLDQGEYGHLKNKCELCLQTKYNSYVGDCFNECICNEYMKYKHLSIIDGQPCVVILTEAKKLELGEAIWEPDFVRDNLRKMLDWLEGLEVNND